MGAYQVLFEHSAIGIAFVGADGCSLRVNPAMVRMLGYSEEELRQVTLSSLTHPEDTIRDIHLFEGLVRGVRDTYEMEKRYICKNNTVMWAKLSVSAVRADSGEFVHAIAMVENITNHKLMERRLRRSNAELLCSNRDLEHFAYAASHDLQTPLRKVKNFAIHLGDEFGDRLDDPMAQKYLSFIIEGAERAQEQVNGLLQFSRTGRKMDMAAFPAQEAVAAALLVLEDDIKEKGALLKVGEDLPTIYADKMLITRVFQNLVGNAIKFRHPERQPEIRIDAEKVDHEWRFSVADNGIGLDMAHSDRIFLIFQRLGQKNGSGLGLALCKRIVERHAGRIWFESEFGEGSTFYFTIPNGSRRHAETQQ